MASSVSLPCRPHAAWRRLLLAAVLGATLRAAENPGELFSLSMEELSQLEIKSDIGSIKARALEEIPAIVSVVPSRQIRESGARDLSDVLLLVPGYALDQDVQSMIGLTFRGLQGQEGKVMVVLDGIEINESLYGSLPILNHFPADIIEQVEIIRGPGAAQYGGSAGLSVIRITTKGGSANQGYAVFAPAYANGHLSTSYAAGLSRTYGDWRVSFNGAFRRDRLSTRTYVSGDGNTTDLGETSAMKPSLLAFGFGWKALDVRCIVDRYQYDDGVNYGEIPARPNDMHFDSLLTSAKYEARVGEWLRIVPQFTYRRQKPWLQHNEELGVFDILAERLQGDLTAIATLTPNAALMMGVRWQRDRAQANDTSVAGEDAGGYFFGTDHLEFADKAAFAQVDIDTKWVNVTLGGRYERHDAVGGQFVPRIALTRAWDRFHLKALYSRAFRTPALVVVADSTGTLQAEQTTNYELEAGYIFGGGLSCSANVFNMMVARPIIYSADESIGSASDAYFNGQDISSVGIETEVRWDRRLVSSYLSYSYYQAGRNDEPYVRADHRRFLGAPAHKVTLNETVHVTKNADWNANAYWLAGRYAYTDAGLSRLSSEWVVNSFFAYRIGRGSIGVGAANLFNSRRLAPQPYDGGTAPFVLKGREYFLKFVVTF